MLSLEGRIEQLEKLVSALLTHQHWALSGDETSPPLYLADGHKLTRYSTESLGYAQGFINLGADNAGSASER